MSKVMERPSTVGPDVVERDDLLSWYLWALDRYGKPQEHREDVPAGADIRTCARCGETVMFRLDPEGGWAFCTVCRKAA